MNPVFYDCEASALEGVPIEIGWAFVDVEGAMISHSSLVRPPAEWHIEELWDPEAEKLHGIGLDELQRDGLPVWEIARRMNEMLIGRELFADDPHDEAWLRLLFDASGADPAFTIRRTDARVLIANLARARGMDDAELDRARVLAARLAPHTHRADADARHLAVFWAMVAKGLPPQP